MVSNKQRYFIATCLQDYYLLSPDALPEDKELREKLSLDRISQVLRDQHNERTSTAFRHRCLFCKTVYEGNRSDLLNHLATDHNFSVGHPDNLVYVEEMLDLIDSKLEKKLCLFCEKTFVSWDGELRWLPRGCLKSLIHSSTEGTYA